MDTCRICSNKFRKNEGGRQEKRKISSTIRKTGVKVLTALKETRGYEGPEEGHICRRCFLKVEREFRKWKEVSVTVPQIQVPSTTNRPTVNHQSTSTPKSSCRRPDRPTSSCGPPRKVLRLVTEPGLSPIQHSVSPITKSPSRTPRLFTATQKQDHTLLKLNRSIKRSHYKTALREILSHSKHAKIALNHIVGQEIKKEVGTFIKNSFHQFDQLSSIEEFSWEDSLDTMKQGLPLLSSVLSAAMPSKKSRKSASNRRKQRLENRYRSVIVPRIGLMFSVILFTKYPNRCQFLQALIGVQMWRCGASENLIKLLNRLGVCLCAGTNRKNVDKLCQETDRELKSWKEALEGKVPSTANLPLESHVLENDVCSTAITNSTAATMPSTMRSILFSDSDCGDTVTQSMLSVRELSKLSEYTFMSEVGFHSEPGFALVWDNTQKLARVRDQGRGNHNTMHLWANAYAARNRVEPSKDIQETSNSLSAEDIALSEYFPRKDDVEMLKERLKAIIGRIITQHIPHFREYYHDVAVWHVPHRFQAESSLQSDLVNIGIIHQNPSTTEGTAEIMKALQVHVPRLPDGRYRVVPTHGDGLSVERMTDAKRFRTVEVTDTDRLEGLEQTPQEFHHRGLMLQDTMNLFFNGKSIDERGTLAQLRQDFDHRNVTTDVMNSFNHADNFIRFTTEAHTVYLTMHLLKMDSITDNPVNSCPTEETSVRKKYLDDLCEHVIGEVWQLPTTNEVARVVEAETNGWSEDLYCCCQEERDGPMAKCSNHECPLGLWYHLQCVGLEECPNPTEDWWCSTECKETCMSVLCCCKMIKEDEMVTCSLGNACTGGIKFHMKCANLTQKPVSIWFCSSTCAEKGGLPQDYIRNYALSLTWYGLLDLCHRDTIREADGLAMMSMWRINFPRFWRGNHYKYMIIAHRLLAGVSGWLPPRLIEEIVHNRTVNLRGGIGNNIAMDRVCEFLNAEFKETLKHTQRNFTDETVRRAGKIVGSLGRSIDKAFQQNVGECSEESSYLKRHNYQEDIEVFVKDYKKDRLFQYMPGRFHRTFQHIVPEMKIRNPAKLKVRLLKYNKKLDRTRSVVE